MNDNYYSLISSVSRPGGESSLQVDGLYLQGRFTANGKIKDQGLVKGVVYMGRPARSNYRSSYHPPLVSVYCLEKDCVNEFHGGYLTIPSGDVDPRLLGDLLEDGTPGCLDDTCVEETVGGLCFISPRSYTKSGYAWFVDLYVLCPQTLTRSFIQRVPLDHDLHFESDLYMLEGVKVAHVVRTDNYVDFEHVYTIYSEDYWTALRPERSYGDKFITSDDQEENTEGILRGLFGLLVSDYYKESEFQIRREICQPAYADLLNIVKVNLIRIAREQVTSGPLAGTFPQLIRGYDIFDTTEVGIEKLLDERCIQDDCLQKETYNHLRLTGPAKLESLLWWILVGCLYEYTSGDRTYRPSIELTAQYVIKQVDDTGLLSNQTEGKTLAVNALACIALAKIYDLTGDPVYVTVLEDLDTQILNNFYKSTYFIGKLGETERTIEGAMFGAWWALTMQRIPVLQTCTFTSLTTTVYSENPLAWTRGMLWNCRMMVNRFGTPVDPGARPTLQGLSYYGTDLTALLCGVEIPLDNSFLKFESIEPLEVYRFKKVSVIRQMVETVPEGYGWFGVTALAGGHTRDLLSSFARSLAVNQATLHRLTLASSIDTVLSAELVYWEEQISQSRHPNETLAHFRERYKSSFEQIVRYQDAIVDGLASYNVAASVSEGTAKILRYAGPNSVSTGMMFASNNRYTAAVVEVYADCTLNAETLRSLGRWVPLGGKLYLEAQLLFNASMDGRPYTGALGYPFEYSLEAPPPPLPPGGVTIVESDGSTDVQEPEPTPPPITYPSCVWVPGRADGWEVLGTVETPGQPGGGVVTLTDAGNPS